MVNTGVTNFCIQASEFSIYLLLKHAAATMFDHRPNQIIKYIYCITGAYFVKNATECCAI